MPCVGEHKHAVQLCTCLGNLDTLIQTRKVLQPLYTLQLTMLVAVTAVKACQFRHTMPCMSTMLLAVICLHVCISVLWNGVVHAGPRALRVSVMTTSASEVCLVCVHDKVWGDVRQYTNELDQDHQYTVMHAHQADF